MAIGRHLGVTVLASAVLAAAAAAQPAADDRGRPIDVAVASPSGIEIGVGSTLVLMFPTVGGHVSLPTRTGLRVEAGTQVLPWLLEDGDDVGLMTQAQLRIPVRATPSGSRRSWLVGITAFTIGDRWDRAGDWSFDTIVRPHAGFSWQWQRSRHLDLRLDVQSVLAGTSVPYVAPFATFSVVWHRERSAS